MQRIECQPAYILHKRPYRETSQILEIFTRDYGRIGVIAKGANRGKSALKGILQPFIPLLISCIGRGELLTLTGVDAIKIYTFLQGPKLASAFYLNELLMRLLHRCDVNPELFHRYDHALQSLGENKEIQAILRLFEKYLLKLLGYGLQLVKDVKTGETVQQESLYVFEPTLGPQLASPNLAGLELKSHLLFKGNSLLAIEQENLISAEILSDAKRLMRHALAPHLGMKPLESRKLL